MCHVEVGRIGALILEVQSCFMCADWREWAVSMLAFSSRLFLCARCNFTFHSSCSSDHYAQFKESILNHSKKFENPWIRQQSKQLYKVISVVTWYISSSDTCSPLSPYLSSRLNWTYPTCHILHCITIRYNLHTVRQTHSASSCCCTGGSHLFFSRCLWNFRRLQNSRAGLGTLQKPQETVSVFHNVCNWFLLCQAALREADVMPGTRLFTVFDRKMLDEKRSSDLSPAVGAVTPTAGWVLCSYPTECRPHVLSGYRSIDQSVSVNGVCWQDAAAPAEQFTCFKSDEWWDWRLINADAYIHFLLARQNHIFQT